MLSTKFLERGLKARKAFQDIKMALFTEPVLQALLPQAPFILTKGYWQIPFAETDRPYMTFATPSGLYQFMKMVFGLNRVATSFQRIIDMTL